MHSELKDVPGYEGYYKVSSCGLVISVALNQALRPTKHRDGYLLVGLSKNSQRKFFTVHRLVMLAFVGPDTRQVNHKNGIKFDNRVENLEYVTPKQNQQHALEMGLVKKGLRHPVKLNLEVAEEIRKQKHLSNYAMAEKYGVSEKAIRDIKSNKTWKTKTKLRKKSKEQHANNINEKR